MEPYTYRPLLPAPYSIRLLQILPGDEESDIYCNIYDYSIPRDRASGPYEALSYVWGDPNERQRIYVQDAKTANTDRGEVGYLDVTVNLYVALQRLRDVVFPRLMWIDAVCIDQENLQERAAQIQFMAMIYSYAIRVVVWLGDEANDSTVVFAELEKVAQNVQHLDQARASENRHYLGLTLDEDRDVVPNTIWSEHSLRALMSRPWFQRIWILQEVAAARHLLIICGRTDIIGAAFTRGLMHCMATQKIRNIGSFVTDIMSWEVLSLKHDPRANRRQNRLNIMPLGELLDRFHLQGASDRRDKIFALLGMCSTSDHINDFPDPDYTKTWSVIFKEAILHVLGVSTKVTTWDHREQAVLTGRGYPLGIVRKEVSEFSEEWFITCSHFSGFYDKTPGTYIWFIPFQTEAYGKDVQEGDILWQMDGAPYPCIIRFCVDHFDIIVISFTIENIRFSDQYGAILNQLDYPLLDINRCRKSPQRSITLVWDWKLASTRTHEHHGSMLANEWQGTSPAMQLLECARIFDDLCDPENLRTLLESFKQYSYEAQNQNYIRLLTVAYTNWTSYTWLKDFIDELRWCLFRLKGGKLCFPESPSCMLEYWECEGFLCLNAAQIAGLANVPWKTTLAIPADQPDTDIVRWDFGQSHHTELLTEFFPDFAPVEEISGQGRNDTSNWNRRFLFHLISAHYGMEHLPSRTSVETLLDQNYYGTFDRSLCIPRTVMIFLAFGSKLNGERLNITRSTLDMKAYDEQDAFSFFSFLFAEAWKDIQSAYSILAVAAHMCRVGNFNHPDEAYDRLRLVDGFVQSESEPSKGNWLDRNLHVIRYYVEHTTLCEVANSHTNDEVLPALFHLVRYRGYDYYNTTLSHHSALKIREVLLRHISNFVEAQER